MLLLLLLLPATVTERVLRIQTVRHKKHSHIFLEKTAPCHATRQSGNKNPKDFFITSTRFVLQFLHIFPPLTTYCSITTFTPLCFLQQLPITPFCPTIYLITFSPVCPTFSLSTITPPCPALVRTPEPRSSHGRGHNEAAMRFSIGTGSLATRGALSHWPPTDRGATGSPVSLMGGTGSTGGGGGHRGWRVRRRVRLGHIRLRSDMIVSAGVGAMTEDTKRVDARTGVRGICLCLIT